MISRDSSLGKKESRFRNPMMKRLTIIGSGPAGLTAAIYAAREGIATTLVEGMKPGGQLTETTEVENFPGFPEGIKGPALMMAMRSQAERFGTEFVFGDADEVDFSGAVKKVVHMSGTAESEAVIIATGATPNWLGLPSEKAFLGRGVSACATCDAPFFRRKKVAVIGGGDAAFTEAEHLARFADSVTIIHRRKEFRASKILVDRIDRNHKIDFMLDTVIAEIVGNEAGTVGGVRVRDARGMEEVKPFDGVFIAIGHSPATAVFKGQIEMDDKGYIIVSDGTKTSMEGVFAAGDVIDPKYKQAVIAAGMGAMAALDAERFLA